MPVSESPRKRTPNSGTSRSMSNQPRLSIMSKPSSRAKSGRCFTIEESKDGRGKGMFAARPVITGEVVVAEAPMLTIQHTPVKHGPSTDEDDEWLDNCPTREIVEAFWGIGPAERRYLLNELTHPAMSDAMLLESISDLEMTFGTPEEELEAATMIAIWTTNNFEGPEGDNTTALCRYACRINHSCVPNVVHAWTDGRLEIRATQGIPAGAEILLCYVLEIEPYASRADGLTVYGFTCKCIACVPGTQYFEESEHRRERICALWHEMMSASHTGTAGSNERSADEAMEKVVQLQALLHREPGMLFFKGSFEALAGGIQLAQHNVGRAMAHLQRAMLLLRITCGDKDDMLEDCEMAIARIEQLNQKAAGGSRAASSKVKQQDRPSMDDGGS